MRSRGCAPRSVRYQVQPGSRLYCDGGNLVKQRVGVVTAMRTSPQSTLTSLSLRHVEESITFWLLVVPICLQSLSVTASHLSTQAEG